MSRVLVNAWKNMRRMPYQTLAAIGVLTVGFVIAQVFGLLVFSSQQILTFLEPRQQVSAYFTDQASEEEILKYKQQLEERDYIQEVTYISKEKALEIYREQNKNDKLLLERVTAEILPASLEVSATAADQLEKVRQDLENLAGVEEEVYQQDVVDALTQWTRGLRWIGLGLTTVLVVTALLIIVVIISMKVASRRQEIMIMRLLGAQRWFVTGPFVTEGAVYGMVGGGVAWLLTMILLLYATPAIVGFIGEIPLKLLDVTVLSVLFGVSILTGIVIGVLGSLVSVRRYL